MENDLIAVKKMNILIYHASIEKLYYICGLRSVYFCDFDDI